MAPNDGAEFVFAVNGGNDWLSCCPLIASSQDEQAWCAAGCKEVPQFAAAGGMEAPLLAAAGCSGVPQLAAAGGMEAPQFAAAGCKEG